MPRRVASMVAPELSFDELLTTLVFLAIALAACLMPAQSDTWWQLRAGGDTWALGHPVLRDTYSYTVAGTFWPNHEWLSETLFYAAYRIGGMPALTLFAAAAALAAWALVWRLTPGSVERRFLLVALVLIPSATAWSVRPQVLTLLGVALALYLVAHGRLVWAPVLMAVWANLHGGFVFGLAILAAAAIGTLVTSGIRRASADAAIVIAAAAATLLTPLGLGLWLEIPSSLARLRAYEVSEWRPPRLTFLPFIPFWAVAALLIALTAWHVRSWTRERLLSRPAERTAIVLAALMLLAVAFTTERNVPPFLLAAVPAIASLWPEAWTRPASARPNRPRLNATIAIGAATITMAVVAYAYAAPLAKLGWSPLPPGSIAALERCPGPIYNRYDEGGYLIWFAPSRKVFIDNRQDPFPPALVEQHIEVERTGEYEDLFQRYAVRCALVAAGSPLAERLLAGGWDPAYADQSWQVLAR